MRISDDFCVLVSLVSLVSCVSGLVSVLVFCRLSSLVLPRKLSPLILTLTLTLTLTLALPLAQALTPTL